jgi:hypothetical protein
MKKTSSFLTGFLAMLVAAGLLSSAGTAQAALISINIGPSGFNIGGINGGVGNGEPAFIINFPISGNGLFLYNNYYGYRGLAGDIVNDALRFAAGVSEATPQKFSLNDSIGNGSTYTTDGALTTFRTPNSVSPNFGGGSYMGFQTSQGNYGWLEVTWTSASSQFQILSGAYESTPNVAILAGPRPAVVPEPGTWAAAALLAGGAGFMRWRKRAKVA